MRNRPTLGTSAALLSAAAVFGFGGGAALALAGGLAGTGSTAQAATVASPAPSTAAATLTLTSDASTTAAGKEFRLSGTLSPATGSTPLTVQRKLPGGDWADFPVSVSTKADGSFSTKVVTQRAGANVFRVVASVSGTSVESPEVTVTVG